MELSILIPWRSDNGSRARAFDYILPRWLSTGADVCIGQDDPDGPFNCSRAQNRAFRLAKHDRLVMFGADQIPDPEVLASVVHTFETEDWPWFPVCAQTAYYTRQDTEQILTGLKDPFSTPFEYTLPFCTGVIALTRGSYEAVGGMDERFSGWGYEDAAFRQSLAGLFGAPPALPHTLRCLWHETNHRIAVSPNEVLMRDYTPLTEPVATALYLQKRGSFV